MQKSKDDVLWQRYVLPALTWDEEDKLPDDAFEVLSSIPSGKFKKRSDEYDAVTAEYSDLGQTLSRAATEGKNNSILAALICGADIESPYEITALQDAALFGKIQAVGILLDRGANIKSENANGHTALNIAANNNCGEMVALLMARNEDVSTEDAWERAGIAKAHTEDCIKREGQIPAHRVPVIDLLNAAPAAEALAKSTGSRDFAFVSALVAAEAGLNVPMFLAQQKNLITREYQGKYPREKAYAAAPPSLQQYITQKMDVRGVDAYTYVSHVLDMVNECAEAAILPNLIPYGCTGEDAEQNTALLARARHIAAAQLLGGLSLPQIFALSDSWHRAGNAIPSHIRHLKSGEWHALMETYDTSVRVPKSALYPPINTSETTTLKIVPLTNTRMLQEEGHRLEHCVGKGSFDDDCLKGKHHILSIRSAEGDQSLATLCVDNQLREIQFQGYNNRSNVTKAKEAWNEFIHAIVNETAQLNAPPSGGWGETETSKHIRLQTGVSELERTMGYRFSEMPIKAEQCAEHYRHKLHQVIDAPREVRCETLGLQTKRVEQRRHQWFPIPDFSPPQFWKALLAQAHLLKSEDQAAFNITWTPIQAEASVGRQ